jgi:glycosyltransferase involved in cell wall biosynthesis
MKICIAGYGYVRESFFNVFRHFPDGQDLVFFLPQKWLAKGGKVTFYPPKEKGVFRGRAYFYHSHYPIIGGLFKGLMPGLPLFLFKHRDTEVVYAPSEPILLTTLFNGFWVKLFGMKHIIFTWENMPYEDKFKGLNLLIRKFIIRLNMFFTDGVVCGNKKAEEIIKKYTNKKTAVIPLSGVDADFFKRERGIKKGFQGKSFEGKIVFLFVGAIGKRKGIHHIIGSFPEILKAIPNAYLIIAGSGEYEKEIDDLVDDLGIRDSITRIPWVGHADLKNLLNISDVFLYPSFSFGGWEEQFGYSMAEASSMELPVISTKSGSIQDVVIDGQTGFLVTPDDQEELRGAMIGLAGDKNLREKLGSAGRLFIQREYSNKEVARKFYNFFNSICPKK